MTLDQLEALLLVQEHDTALDRLAHRRATLSARDELLTARGQTAAREHAVAALRDRLHEVLTEERHFDDDVQRLAAKAQEVDRHLYSGAVASPRELQALQADLDQLRRQQRAAEDRELELMEARESIERELGDAEGSLGTAVAEVDKLAAELAAGEAEVDAEVAAELAARAELAAKIPADLLDDYQRRRHANRGAGAARLVGTTCQGCHLSIPSTEAERIRRGAGEVVAYCDNCACILVPA